MTNIKRVFWGLRVDIDWPRLALVAASLLLTSIGGVLVNAPIPFLHLELIVIAPLLLTRAGQVAAITAITIEVLRVIQVPFGFDQIFVASYLLLRNITAFPPVYAIATIALVIVPPAALYVIFQKLPMRAWSVPLIPALLLLVCVATALKLGKDLTKINLVGTSFGHAYGQIRFSSMLYAHYTTPGVSPTVQPGVIGARTALATGANDWLILMESGGYPTDLEMRNALFAPFLTPQMQAKYRVSVGATPSVGSTIHGEIRQLCNGVLVDGLFGTHNHHCIPWLFDVAGWSTTSVHANNKAVYDRVDWYPKFGINTIISADTPDFPNNKPGGRWGTLDDITAIDWTASHLLNQKRSFVYLLTVSTHLPALQMKGAMLDARCVAKHDEQSCMHLANMQLVLAHIAAVAATLPYTVVTLVGDHPPPFVSMYSSSAFDRTRVTEISLTPRTILVDTP